MRHLLCLACLAFAACSGGGQGCGGAGIASASPGCSGGSPTSNAFKLSVHRGVEIEPNDDIATANAVYMPTPAAPEDIAGFVIGGTVHDTRDSTDIFSFTSLRARRIFFKLCESSCDTRFETDKDGNPDSLLVWAAYFDVLDADGRIIATTLGGNPIENYGDLYIDAGVIIYIAVHANDTFHVDQPYQISAFEMANF